MTDRPIVALVVTLVALGACSTLTEVDAPDVLQPDALDNPQGAETLRIGAVGRFQVAYGGSQGQVILSGLLTDELTATIPGAPGEDSRNIIEGTGGPYDKLQVARVASLQAIAALQRFVPEAVGKIAQLFAQVGYVELFFAEMQCSGVPLSTMADGDPAYGPALTTAELLDQALDDFDSAAVHAADSARLLGLVQVGRGRALLQQGRFDDAAAAVSGVPTDYRFLAEFGPEQANGVFQDISTSREFSVSDMEGTNGLDFRSAGDPRVPTLLLGVGPDGETEVHGLATANTASASIPLASGVEARLIEAEAALQVGSGDWLTLLNDLRATAITPDLPPLADPGTTEGRVDLLFRERAFWLFGSGHRQGDLRRLVRQYGRAQDAVFPTGSYKGRGLYGPEVTYTVPSSEGPNPHWTGSCLSREA